MEDLKIDCYFYRGEVPCQYGNKCLGCNHYRPLEERILIVKLGALGDVLRTTSLLPGLRDRFPKAEITWVTEESSYPLLKMVPGLDQIYTTDRESLLILTTERFHRVYNFDKVPLALALAKKLSAPNKYGFSKTDLGKLTVFNAASGYALKLGVDDELKFFRNNLTYQELIYQMAELPYQGQGYQLEIPLAAQEEIEDLLSRSGGKAREPLIGLNTGSGKRFASKQWSKEHFCKLIEKILNQTRAQVILLGGEAEEERNREIYNSFSSPRVFYLGHFPLDRFCALVNCCSAVISADSLAMHIAIALEKYTVALFGPTCSVEIDLYGRGEKIIGLERCSPCYLAECKLPLSCVNRIGAGEVFQALLRGLPEEVRCAPHPPAGRETIVV